MEDKVHSSTNRNELEFQKQLVNFFSILWSAVEKSVEQTFAEVRIGNRGRVVPSTSPPGPKFNIFRDEKTKNLRHWTAALPTSHVLQQYDLV